MAQKNYAGITINVTDEGYTMNPSQWTKEHVIDILTVGEFYALAGGEGSQIIFT
jgi:hypothetical protein